jgi:hypothetical protein
MVDTPLISETTSRANFIGATSLQNTSLTEESNMAQPTPDKRYGVQCTCISQPWNRQQVIGYGSTPLIATSRSIRLIAEMMRDSVKVRGAGPTQVTATFEVVERPDK